MLLELDSEQEFLQKTTARFLEDQASVTELRRLRDDPGGYKPDFWRQGAELGWTSLLVAEDDGGVAISDSGLVDLTLVAHEFGTHAAPGPLVGTNVVAGALSAAGGHGDLIERLLDGSTIGAWAFTEGTATGDFTDVRLEITVSGDELILNGVKRPVESAERASHLLVSGRADSGPTQVLVPTDAAGLSITAMKTVDMTRRFAVVKFDNVRVPASAVVGEVGQAGAAIEQQLQHALVIANAESVGAMQRGFDMTVEWAFDRYSFGRPLASYQALKHRFAHMATWLEASHAISDEAARAVSDKSPNAAKLVSAAKAYVGTYGTELLQEAVQLHGGIGVTFEHDLHLFLRRVTLDRALFGTPDAHQRRIAGIVAQKEG